MNVPGACTDAWPDCAGSWQAGRNATKWHALGLSVVMLDAHRAVGLTERFVAAQMPRCPHSHLG